MALDFRREPSGGPVMPQPPHGDDADVLDDPESRFLIALWDSLERACDLATAHNVLERLDEVLQQCEAAAGLIRGWRSEVR